MILDIPAGAPLLSITRTTTDGQGEPFEFSHDLFRSDRTRIIVRTPGAQGGITRTPHGRGQVIELRADGSVSLYASDSGWTARTAAATG